MIVKSPTGLLDEPAPDSVDDLINGLIDQTPNETSEFLEDWSPDAVGHHDVASLVMTGLSWIAIMVVVSVCLKRAFGVPLDAVPDIIGLAAVPPADDE